MTDDPDLEGAYALSTPADNLAFYKTWAEDYDATFVQQTSYQFPRVVSESYLSQGGGWPCLDVGCGTGAIAEHMPDGAVIDGLDLSPDMLAVAAGKRIYRNLVEANLKATLPQADATYTGIVSAGTFTHGHVGPEAFGELVRIMAPGGLAVITVKPEIWEALGFAPAFGKLVEMRSISPPEIEEMPVYGNPAKAPEGHADDKGFIVSFRRL